MLTYEFDADEMVVACMYYINHAFGYTSDVKRANGGTVVRKHDNSIVVRVYRKAEGTQQPGKAVTPLKAAKQEDKARSELTT